MIEVELIQPDAQWSGKYERVGLFRVDAAGEIDVREGHERVEGLRTIRVADPARGGFVGADEDAAAWARNLDGALRTPYLRAIIRELDDADPQH